MLDLSLIWYTIIPDQDQLICCLSQTFVPCSPISGDARVDQICREYLGGCGSQMAKTLLECPRYQIAVIAMKRVRLASSAQVLWVVEHPQPQFFCVIPDLQSVYFRVAAFSAMYAPVRLGYSRHHQHCAR